MNREYHAISRGRRQSERMEAPDVVSFENMVRRPLPNSAYGQTISSDDALEATVDAFESWLFDAYRLPTADTHEKADLNLAWASACRRYSFQRGLNDIWNQGIWEGWRLSAKNGTLYFEPTDYPVATRLEAAQIRQQSNFMNFPWVDLSVWTTLKPESRQKMALPRTITEVRITKERRRFRVGRPPCRSRAPHHYVFEKAGLEGSYLARFLDIPFPNDPRLNCRLLLTGWHVILDLARALTANTDPASSLS